MTGESIIEINEKGNLTAKVDCIVCINGKFIELKKGEKIDCKKT